MKKKMYLCADLFTYVNKSKYIVRKLILKQHFLFSF